MKLGPVTELVERNKTTSKKLTLTSCRKIVTPLSFFTFLVNLEQFRGRIPDTEFPKSCVFSKSNLLSYKK